ncbi:hypothetical protein [Alkalihalobacterium elongatum]|nr:hypothetical protein [Alkalihalobacterium elongatum]
MIFYQQRSNTAKYPATHSTHFTFDIYNSLQSIPQSLKQVDGGSDFL